MSEYFNRYLSKNVQKASKHMKRCPTLLKVGQLKTTVIYYFTFTRMAIKLRQCYSYFYVSTWLDQGCPAIWLNLISDCVCKGVSVWD